MKRLLLALSLALMPFGALACDNYTSALKAPGERVLEDYVDELVVREGPREVRYTTGSAGTGSGVRVAFPADGGEPVSIEQRPGQYQLGTETFTAYCD